MTGVAWRGVTVRFGATVVVDDVDAEARAGVHAFVGANGAGKSTLLDTVVGAVRPHAGEVLVGGARVRPGSRGAVRVGWMQQAPSFPATLRAGEVLALVAAHASPRPPTDGVAAAFGLADLLRRQCGGLSGGQTRRLALACALMGSPDVLVLDEPSSGLDDEHRGALHAAVAAARDRGATVLLSSHDLAEVARLADAVHVVAAGRIVDSGEPAALVRRLERVVVAFTPDDATAATSERTLASWRGRLRRIDPDAVVGREGERIVVATTRADAIARDVLAAAASPTITVQRPSLEEAVGVLVRESVAGAEA